MKTVPVTTDAERMALSDYVFVRIAAPFTVDPDSGSFSYPLQSLEYAGNANAAALQPVVDARSAITAWNQAHPTSPRRPRSSSAWTPDGPRW